MQLMILLTADYANIDRPSEKLNVLGAFKYIFADRFPHRHNRMAVVVKLRPDFGDHSDDRELSIVLYDADGIELVRFAIPFSFPLGEGGHRPEFQGVIELNNLEFPRPGIYEFTVMVDDQVLGSTPVELRAPIAR